MKTPSKFDSKEFLHILGIMGRIWAICAVGLLIVMEVRPSWWTGQVGDSFGVLNSITSLLAFGALWYSIRLQKEELSDTRAVLQEQTEIQQLQTNNLSKQSFETTFFNLLASSRSMIDGIQFIEPGHKIVRAEGKDSFMKIINMHNEVIAHTVEYPVKKEKFQMVTKSSMFSMREYLQSTDVLLIFIDKNHSGNDPISSANKQFYLSIIAATFTNKQKQFLERLAMYGDDKREVNERLRQLVAAAQKTDLENES